MGISALIPSSFKATTSEHEFLPHPVTSSLNFLLIERNRGVWVPLQVCSNRDSERFPCRWIRNSIFGRSGDSSSFLRVAPGADTWIDRVVADIPNAENGFTLIFSSTPFPGYQYRLDWRRSESGGNW